MDNRELVEINSLSLPDEIMKWTGNAAIYESGGNSGAKTMYINRNGGAYLKIAGRGTLRRSSVMQDFFYRRGLSSPVLRYLSADRDYLITAPMKGEDGVSDKYISKPEKLSEVFALALRSLHDTDIAGCALEDQRTGLLSMSETAVFRQRILDGISEYIGTADAKQAEDEIAITRGLLKSDVLIHGDYCLPNIILDDWNFEGFIDLGDSGRGDRHYDLAYGLWTLYKNLKSQKYGQRFLDAYGWNDIDRDRLRVCGLLVAIE